MNWLWLRPFPRLDTRAQFVAQSPRNGTLLDLGSSDGETLNHFAELRPDLQLFAADKFGSPDNYPAGCRFYRVDFETEKLPLPNASIDCVTCMHLVEHMQDTGGLLAEIDRLLKPGGSAYFETPHEKTSELPSLKDGPITFTMNFYDDPTHVRPVSIKSLQHAVQKAGLRVEKTGTSRNWLFAAAHPFFRFLPASRKRFTAQVHWIGWSAFLVARKPE